MIVMAMLAFFVFVSRYYVTCRNRQFEQSRWMIVVALLLFVVHYMCQMRLGWRQQGNDVGVLFNLLFYSPSAILLSWSQLNILRAGHRRWSFMRYGVVGYALMVLCIVAGVISNGSLHIGPMLYVADAIHFFTLLYVAGTMLRAGKLQDLTGRVVPHVTAAYWARTTEPMVPTPSFSILLTATFYSTLLPDQSA